MHDTLGYVELYVNGVLVNSAYNIDTKQISTSTVIDTFHAGGGGSGNTNKFDDLYLATDGGAPLGVQRYGTVTDVLAEPFNNLTAWTTVGGAPAITASGRNGNAVDLTSAGATIDYLIGAGVRNYMLTVGFAAKFVFTGAGIFLSLRSDAGATQHISVLVGIDGSLSVLRGTINSLAVSAPGVIVAATWYYIELQALLHDTAGAVTLRLNGAVVASAVDVDTKNAGTLTVFDSVRLAQGNGPNPTIDDLRLRTGTLADFLGDVVVP
jgi:hypothetical protein